jgi:hypothetical protein
MLILLTLAGMKLRVLLVIEPLTISSLFRKVAVLQSVEASREHQDISRDY